MKKMLKRADGSYSQRGLWDNIRANKGSGKEPTKEMLKQEKKIKASSKETGGKKYQTGNFKIGTVTGLSASASPSKQCVGAGCKDVIAGGSSYAGVSGSNYTGKGATGLSSKPQYSDRVVYLTPEEKAAGIANEAKYKAEGEMRMEGKRYEASLRSGKGDFSTGMDPAMVKDKGNVGTKFYTRQKTGGKKSSWLEESKELKFGGKKKKMGGKNC